MTDKMLGLISQQFALTPIDAGEYCKMKVNAMNFDISAYHAKGLGHISVMKAKGFFGLMKMDTLIINPTEKDLPLFSYDRVLAMGNDTLIFELYDTLLGNCDLSAVKMIKDESKALPDHDLGEHWYDSIKLDISISKKGKKAQTSSFDKLSEDYLSAFISCAGNAETCDKSSKQEKASVYVEGLLSNGGPSTDVFKKGIGFEKTADLFRRILFGTRI